MPSRYQQEQLEFARAHLGRVYYPWNPLVTIITDHRIYPTEDALYYLWLTNQVPPAAAVAAAVPKQAIVIYHEPEPAGFAAAFLKSARAQVGDLGHAETGMQPARQFP